MHLYVHSSTVHNSQNTEATYAPTDEWMKKVLCICAYTHTHNGILLSHRKEQNNAICSNMIKLEIIILSEVSQEEKDKYHVTYMWNLKHGTSEPI